MKKPIYLDNAAATRLDERVLEAMKPYFFDTYAVATSEFAYSQGIEAGEALEKAIATLMNSWTAEEAKDIDVLISESDLAALEQSLRSKLSQQLQSGMEIRVGAGLAGGFRVSMKDGSSYYNFTPAEIATVLSEFLNPRLTEILQQAVS